MAGGVLPFMGRPSEVRCYGRARLLPSRLGARLGRSLALPQERPAQGVERDHQVEEDEIMAGQIDSLYRASRRAALLGLGVALALGVAKLAGGLWGHSLALLSDAVHSLGDALASALVWGALVWAQRPADREHPYGHTRAEAVAG